MSCAGVLWSGLTILIFFIFAQEAEPLYSVLGPAHWVAGSGFEAVGPLTGGTLCVTGISVAFLDGLRRPQNLSEPKRGRDLVHPVGMATPQHGLTQFNHKATCSAYPQTTVPDRR